MASFVQYNETPQPENYTGRSRGVDAPKPNAALGTLFEGLGNVVDAGVKFVDERNVRTINKELETGIDAIRGAQGVDAAVTDATITGGETGANVPGGGTSPPPGVSVATSEIARINQAYKEGKIGDTYYYSKVEALARQVRNKHPGYREQIDQKVSSIIGTNPANALRTSLISDLKAAQSTAQSRQNSDESIIERGKDKLSPDKYRRFIQGDRSPEFVAEMKRDIQLGEVKQTTVNSLKSEYELRKAQGAARKEDLEKVVTRDSSDTVWNILNSGIESVDGGKLTIDSLNAKIAGMASGKPPTPEELGALRSGTNALIAQANLALDRLHSQPWGKDGKMTYQQEINDSASLQRIKEQALQPIRNMEKALTDGNIGMFQWYANQAKLMKDQKTQDIFTRSETALNLSVANEILGPNLGQLLLGSGVFSKSASELARVLTMDSVVKSGTGRTDGETILRDSKREAATGGGANGAKDSVGSVLATTKITLSNKDISEQALANYAKTWFNPERNFITARDILTENSRQSVIQMFSAPEVVDNMVRLKNSNPEVWNNYKRWVESSTRSVFNSTLGQVAEWQKPGSGYAVTVDSQGRISVARDRSLPTDQFTGGVDRAVEAIQKPLGQLNSAIDARRRIAKAEGADPNATATQFLGAMGVNPTPTETAKPDPTEGAANNSSATPTVELANFAPEDREMLVELERGSEAVDLEARDRRRASNTGTADPNWRSAGASIQDTAELRDAIPAAAKELGVSPEDLATVISYETGGTFSPGIRGGAGNRHIGLIQFGPAEQAMYGANQQQSAAEQMRAVVKYLKHRGFRQGMDILDLYSTINAGSPGRYGASDANNGGAPGTVRDKVNNQMGAHRRKARALLGLE